ncbi:MAG: hypothetical protein AAGA77_15110 [Bacteroidota bacterium]
MGNQQPAKINTINEVSTLIQNHLEGNTLRLKSADFEELTIRTLLNNFFGDDVLIFNGYKTDTEDDKSLTALAHLQNEFLGAQNLAASINFSVPDGKIALSITFSDFPQEWTFSKAFRQLTGSLIDQFQFNEPSFTLDSQNPKALPNDFRKQLGFQNPDNIPESKIKKGLYFSATLITAQLSQPLMWLFSDENHKELKIEGPVEIKAEFVEMWLRSVKGREFEVLGKKLPLSLQLISVLSDQNITTKKGSPFTFGQIVSKSTYTLGGKEQDIPFAGRFLLPNMKAINWVANLEAAKISIGLEDIGSIIGNSSNISKQLLDDFPHDSIYLNRLQATLLNGRKEIEIQNSSVVVELENKEASLFGWDWLTFDVFKLIFSTGFTLKSTSIAAYTQAIISGDETIKLDAYITLPDMGFSIRLPAGKEFDIASFLSRLSLDIPGLKSTKCSSFALDGNFKEDYYGLSCQLTDVWELDFEGSKAFEIEEIQLSLSHASKGNGGYLEGKFNLENTIQFEVIANHDIGEDGWFLQGQTLQTVTLSDMLDAIEKYFDGSFNISEDIQLKSAKIQIDTVNKAFKLFADTDYKPDFQIFDQKLDLEVMANLETYMDQSIKKRIFTGFFEGDLKVGECTFTARIDMTKTDKKLTASWSTMTDKGLTVHDVAAFLGIEFDVHIDSALDLSLNKATLEIDFTKEEFTLSAQSRNYGEAFITAGKDNSTTPKLAIVFGVNMDGIPKLSKLPGIGKDFKDADILDVNQVGVMVSSGTFKNFKIPNLPPLTVDTESFKSIPAAGTIKPIAPMVAQSQLTLSPGVSGVAIIDLNTGNNSKLKNLESILGNAEVVLQAEFGKVAGGMEGVMLFIGLENIGIPVSKHKKLRLEEAGIKFTVTDEIIVQLIGAIQFKLFGNQIEAKAILSIDESEAEVAINVESDTSILPTPKALQGVKLKDFGLEMGLFFEPPGFDFGVEGKAEIGEDAAHLDTFGLVLEIVEADPFPIPDPIYLSFYIDKLDFGKLLTTFTDIKDSAIEKALSIVKGSGISFYWAENVIILPDGSTAQPGVGFGARIDVFNFGFMGDFKATISTGIQGKAQCAPINIKDVLKATGDGKEVSRKYESVNDKHKIIKNNKIIRKKANDAQKEVIIKAGGPVFEVSTISSPYLNVNFLVSLFDIVDFEINAIINNEGIKFKLDFDVKNIERFTLECQLNDWSSFNAHADIKIGINRTLGPIEINGINLGSIDLDINVESDSNDKNDPSNLHIELSEDNFSLKVDGKFEFEGTTIKLPQLHLKEAPSSLADIPDKVFDWIKKNASELFGFIFHDAEKWARDAADGIIHGAKDIGRVLFKHFGATAMKCASIMKGIGKSAEVVGQVLKNEYGLGLQEAVNILHSADYGASEVAGAMKGVYNASAKEVVGVMKGTYHLGKGAVKGILHGVGYASDAIEGALSSAFGTITHDLNPRHWG